MSWIMILLSLIGNLPTIWNLIKEILAMLRKQPIEVQNSIKTQVMNAVQNCKDDRVMGIDPDHHLLLGRLSEILARLKGQR